MYAALHALADDPWRPRPGADIRRLSGRQGELAIRVGGYRCIYQVDGWLVRVTRIDGRGRVYDR